MTTNNFFSLRNLAMLAMGLMAILFASTSNVHAQEGVNPTKVHAEIEGLSDDCFPLDVVYNYDGGEQAITYKENGVQDDEALQDVGQFHSVKVGDTIIKVGEEADVQIAALRPRIKVTFDPTTGEIVIRIKLW